MIVLQMLDNFLPSFVLGVTPFHAMCSEMLFLRVGDSTMNAYESLRRSIPVTACHTSVGIFMLFFVFLPIEVILVGAGADGTRVRAARLIQILCMWSISSMLLAHRDLMSGT